MLGGVCFLFNLYEGFEDLESEAYECQRICSRSHLV